MSFDVLAPHYRWMEFLLAGRKLQRCRTAFLPQVGQARNVLLLGEGNGRFLAAFTEANRVANVTVLDASKAMLREARRRVSKGNGGRVNYVQADILAWSAPRQSFDLIVTNFFLDCFRPEQLGLLIPRLGAAASENAQWLISDFRVPPRGLLRWRARWIIAAMYCFFRVVTRVAARTLAPVDSLLEASGFRLSERRLSEWGLLHTDLWQRSSGGNELRQMH